MGMDVYGKKPTSEKGEYFRNNVWWWHPLWDFCCYLKPDLINQVPNAHDNSGDGLSAVLSRHLGFKLQESIITGQAQKYVDSYYESINSSPDEPCFCVNKSLIEVYSSTAEIPFPASKDPNPNCNICKGSGLQSNFLKNYHISVENIQNFANFLLDCGGFQIC